MQQNWAIILIAPDTSPQDLKLSGEGKSWNFGSVSGFYIYTSKQPWRDHYRMEDYVVNELFTLVDE